MVRFLAAATILATVTALLGCQREPAFSFAPVEGTVTRGGKPLADVIVVFWNDADSGLAPLSSGATDAQGHYRLHTDQGVEGAVVGRHRVCILDRATLPNLMSTPKREGNRRPTEMPAPASLLVPPGYSRKDETPIHVEVRPGEQVIDLEVK